MSAKFKIALSLGPPARGAAVAFWLPTPLRAVAPTTPRPARPAFRRKTRRSASFSALRLIMSTTTFFPNMLLLI